MLYLCQFGQIVIFGSEDSMQTRLFSYSYMVLVTLTFSSMSPNPYNSFRLSYISICKRSNGSQIRAQTNSYADFNADRTNAPNHMHTAKTGPEVIKLISCSTQLSTKFQLLIKLRNRQMKGFLVFSLSGVAFTMLINRHLSAIVLYLPLHTF